MSKNITATELSKLLQETSDLVIVDVRRKSDYEADKEEIREPCGGIRNRLRSGARTSPSRRTSSFIV